MVEKKETILDFAYHLSLRILLVEGGSFDHTLSEGIRTW